jgi:hypothetical protein
MAQARLNAAAAALADREYLEKQFSGADVLMTTVLRMLRHTTVVSDMTRCAPLRLGIARSILVHEPAVGVGTHHIDIGAGGEVTRVASPPASPKRCRVRPAQGASNGDG